MRRAGADRFGSKHLDLLDGGDRRLDRALFLRQGDLALVNCSVQKTAMKRSLLVLSTISLLWSTFAHAMDDQQHGKELLQKLCARCHAVGRTGASPNRLAPPFRSFSETKLYDSDFMQRLQEGYSSIHRFMPTFHFNRDDAQAVVNYMKSIQEPTKPK
jgi:mono/diheme cytochrome c family protein